MEEDEYTDLPFTEIAPDDSQSAEWNDGKCISPYQPSTQSKIEHILSTISWQPYDTLFDLGCGDGRVLITAIRQGCTRAVGIDMDSKVVEKARKNIAESEYGESIEVLERDMMEVDMTSADIIFVYLLPAALSMLVPKLIDLFENHRLRLVVSNLFEIKNLPYRQSVDYSRGYYTYFK
jgi:ribosomal protein L11 methylase PrmA